MTALLTEPLRGVLERLHDAARHDDDLHLAPPPPDASAQQRADALASAYLPVSAEGGRLLYSLVRSARPRTVVEFGTSYGISTLYLAAAVRDNGAGKVVTTELSAAKVAAARANLADAGVADVVEVLPGDARQTLAAIDGPVGLVLLDGWKDLYLPVLRLLEPQLAPGALVIGDDTSFATVRPYLDYVRDPASGYLSVDFPVEDGMEISCYAG
ncbi:class I SAM-dependent methyltransferase [Phytohabitans sp. ZYX-F-186]|uniref:Class I SAM-dependent methyltransferase n=1 Tax=Phytohabitans maris TaxID=3071409 RepID=A0ABU0ZD88_9ACTN|nr:class I SAM-dependent methyltransferase [Phytohabitans sp. ZYX-F-186]MDQ7905008.1 class I SAM-dependent methyltransferase [Phytohabitans sp. ZYX-F-186]